MSIVNSLFLGSEGSYDILGCSVTFYNDSRVPYGIPDVIGGDDPISRLASTCINNQLFRWISLGYTHVFVHEMGHALAYRLFTGESSRIEIYPSCVGMAHPHEKIAHVADWKKTIASAAGPMADIAFSALKLIAAITLQSYLSLPVSLVLGFGAVAWISGEALYAYSSAVNLDNGDFGRIANRGNIHLALASTALIAEITLTVFTVATLCC